MNNKRRDFLKKTLVAGTASVFGPPLLHASPKQQDSKEGKGFTFLFQGDSITDGNRTRNNDWNHVMGEPWVTQHLAQR